jgi:hypothetical protein
VRFYVGFDRSTGDLTLPAFAGDAYRRDCHGIEAIDGEIVGELRRRPVDGAKVRAIRGHPRAPYPNLPATGPLLLVAGELDALTGRQLGLPAVTVSGAKLPEHSEHAFRGRTVAVLFDAGPEEAAAQKIVQRLRAAGGRAWAVRLSRLGFRDDYDLNDWLRDGASPEDVRRFINDERIRRRSR